jgi:hypothetical protein
VNLAARGLRDMDEGPERVTDPEQRERSRREARKVHLGSAATALLLTAVALVL